MIRLPRAFPRTTRRRTPARLGRAVGCAARILRAFMVARDGAIAIQFAIAGPAVLMVGLGAIDLVAVMGAKNRIQDIADAAALAGAPALSLATDGRAAEEQANAFVQAQMADWGDAPSYVPTFEVVDHGGQRALHVLLRGNRPSFFVNLFPPGGWDITGEATATSVGLAPLCVLVTSDQKAKVLNIKDRSRLSAPACMVHSNHDIAVEGGTLAAAAVQAVTSARGMISPAANVGAVRIDDPFAALDLNYSKKLSCSEEEIKTKKIRIDSKTETIPPGLHCGGIEVLGTGQIILAPGDHFFLGGDLIVKEDARMDGFDVAVFFDKESKFEFKDRALVKLEGRKEGPYSGVVMGGTRDNTQDFLISADNVDSLLGVIYVPSARLIVEGKEDVARDSAWTVIVAKELQLKGSPSLFINANYSASAVPVPAGVGNRAGGSRLID